MQEANRSASSLPPLIAVIGTTGAGKSRLAIELAKAIGGEVVSADSMQVYKGYHVATAKVTDEEMEGVVHHLLGEVDPLDTTFNVTKFRDLALPVIEDIHKRGLVPILVGGTHYYIEAIIWADSILGANPTTSTPNEQALGEGTTGASDKPQSLWEELQLVDPVMAQRLHPKNERKIRRSLEVFRETGQRHSELLNLQDQKMRYNCCFFWVFCEPGALALRLDKRVDIMLQKGLLDEVEELETLFAKAGKTIDPTKGIMQSIGYKEFQEYLEARRRVRDHQEEAEKEHPEQKLAEAALRNCVDTLKQRTRHYAKVQLRWIQRRLRPCVPVYRLDTTDVSAWAERVHDPAVEITRAWLTRVGWGSSEGRSESPLWQEGIGFDDYESLPHADKLLVPESVPEGNGGTKRKRGALKGEEEEKKWKNYVCDVCNGKTLRGDKEWETHLRSKAHKSRKRRKAKQAAPVQPAKDT